MNELIIMTRMPLDSLLHPSTFEHITFTDPEYALIFFCDHLDDEIDTSLWDKDDMPIVVQCRSFIFQLATFQQVAG